MGYVRSRAGRTSSRLNVDRRLATERGSGMADSSSPLRLWEMGVPARARPHPPPACSATPLTLADRLAAREALRALPQHREIGPPFSLQWFLDVEALRHGRHGRWIPHLLEFAKHAGERLLGLGPGLGSDWVQYARHGADVVACCQGADQLDLVRRNFELRGLSAAVLHASPTALPLDSGSIDVACLSGLPDGGRPPGPLVAEIYRVLKPGGKVVAVMPAWRDVDWVRRWRRGGSPDAETGWPLPADEPRFTARQLRGLFAAFVEPRFWKRHLRRSEVPPLWRWLPLCLLERAVGRLLVFKGFKPLSAALPLQRAA
jgi:SAM-dependent methyltransferase